MQIHFEFAYFSFFPYSFGIETINTLIHSIPNSRPKWAKCMSVSDQNGAKTLSDRGDTYLYGLYKGIPPPPLSPAPPPPPGLKHSAVSITIHICNNKSSVYVQLFDLSQPKAVGKTYRSSRFLALNPLMEPWK